MKNLASKVRSYGPFWIPALATTFLLTGCTRDVFASQDPNELIQESQRRLTAVTDGDQEAFQKGLDPDGIFVDENGTVRTGTELAKEIQPLPPGYSGRLQLAHAKVGRFEDTFVVSYDVLEDLKLYGQGLKTRYHTTDVYAMRGPGWQLVGAQTSVYPSELKGDPTARPRAAELVGRYRLGEGPIARIVANGSKLQYQREGREPTDMIPVGPDRFVRPGQPRGEILFRRNSDSAVVALLDRRDNQDLVWRRLTQ